MALTISNPVVERLSGASDPNRQPNPSTSAQRLPGDGAPLASRVLGVAREGEPRSVREPGAALDLGRDAVPVRGEGQDPIPPSISDTLPIIPPTLNDVLAALGAGPSDTPLRPTRTDRQTANQEAVEPRIRETSAALDRTNASRNQILQERDSAAVVQANSDPDSVLALLRR